jgi:hypothetical protein
MFGQCFVNLFLKTIRGRLYFSPVLQTALQIVNMAFQRKGLTNDHNTASDLGKSKIIRVHNQGCG